MIKCEVVFEGNDIRIGEHSIYRSKYGYGIYNMVNYFDDLEQAIKWCMEN